MDTSPSPPPLGAQSDRALLVLITGGAGFIGTHLARRLVAQGHSVRLLDVAPASVIDEGSPPASSEIERVCADVRDADAVTAAMDGVDVVHHLAAETGVGESQYDFANYVHTNTFGTAVVLSAAVAAKVQHVVIASSRAVYGEGQSLCSHCRRSFSGHTRRVGDLDGGMWDVLCPSCGHAARRPSLSHFGPRQCTDSQNSTWSNSARWWATFITCQLPRSAFSTSTARDNRCRIRTSAFSALSSGRFVLAVLSSSTRTDRCSGTSSTLMTWLTFFPS